MVKNLKNKTKLKTNNKSKSMTRQRGVKIQINEKLIFFPLTIFLQKELRNIVVF